MVDPDPWQASAAAWVADMGEHGDFGRRYVLDPVMLPRALALSPRNALDVGCGEGRFCRMLKQRGVRATTGIDPTPALISTALLRDPTGAYVRAGAENLPFRDDSFDLVISYLTLIDIAGFARAIREMARVLQPGGALLIANLNGFNTAQRLHGDYLNERAMWIEYRGIRIVNYHRPLSAYLRVLLDAGLQLTYFDEPQPTADAPPAKADDYRRVPWFLTMEWRKPESESNG
jgi:SAM-dependent methyltransferase